MTGRPVSRREVLVLGGLGVAAVATGAAGWALSEASSGSGPFGPAPGTTAGAASGVVGEDLVEPPVLTSRDGRLAVELVAAPGVRLAGRQTGALGYNGRSPGPTLRVRAGDELAIRLTNRLDQPTNLHTHGLRVSPHANSDNPFIRIDPGASFDYLYRIPADHPAGTQWYHPHHHGTVADQLFGGLAGALLVDVGGPGLAVERERVLLVTDTTLGTDGQVATVGPMDRMMGRHGRLVLVNGQLQPTISAGSGTVQRWRIINGCTSRVLPLRLTGPGLIQIALDGAYLPAPERAAPVLAPGNRADVLVLAEEPGRFELSADAFDRGGMAGMGGMGGSATSPPVTLATLVVDGPSRPAPPPPTIPPAPPAVTTPVTNHRQITLAAGMGATGGGMGMSFTFNGRSFDAGRDDQTVRFGDVEEWTLLNTSPMAHPIHVHAWGFTVVADSTGNQLPGTPQDVVLVPAGGWARIRIPFTTYSGRSVYHCHILDHEDAGMMATINVTDTA